MNLQTMTEDAAAVGKVITSAPAKAVGFLETLATLPEHIWHLALVGLGAFLTCHGQKELGSSLVVAGVGMFRGVSK